MELKDALLEYAVKHMRSLAEEYSRPFDLGSLAITLRVTGTHCLERNINLRLALHRQWMRAPQHRKQLVNWYIREWGGIKTNSPDTLARYSTIDTRRLIARREIGIASWSKALSIADPGNFVIYDARIASALHSIQLLRGVKKPIYFPDLNSRHSRIKPIVQACRKNIKPFWAPVKKLTFYEDYNNTLKDVAAILGNGTTPHTLEILLSSHAISLASQWMHQPEDKCRLTSVYQ